MFRRPPRSTQSSSSAASDVYKRQDFGIVLIGGKAYAPAARIFRYLIPVLFFSFFALLFGWPTLGAIDRNAETSRSTVYALSCLLYTSDAADDLLCVELGGSRITKKKKKTCFWEESQLILYARSVATL